MTPRTHLLWPVLLALTAGACTRQQQPAYYVDSVTGQPVAMAQMPQMAPQQPQPQRTASHSQQQTPERGLYNTFYSQSSPPVPQYQAPVYAQQQPPQPAYTAQTHTPPAYKPAQQVAQAQVYTQPQVYAQQQPAYRQPAPQYYQPYTGGPYAAAPQANPYAQARWY